LDKNIIIRTFRKGDEIKGGYIIKIKNYPHRGNLNVGHIMELLFDPLEPGLPHTMFSDCADAGKKNNADILHVYSHPAQQDYDHLKNFGFKRFDSKNYIINILGDEKEFPGIAEPGNWFISLGDSDRA
jgi:hypothetical protein